ncbi:thioredoxin [Corynebacterium phocae]|uniref:Thioredoxin n=1 Tax=Corynebacterium phocae TaxID=161895 RepID=A0A1L7D3S3_9CORY|nr:tetratricopeptide repeat protein [Corynebacterium phocae]APT92755.1 thioredoxin [Corynebacterium phocae]KAA8723066.1 tetratricopeptide repeat protein [Corynebacterium phocae]
MTTPQSMTGGVLDLAQLKAQAEAKAGATSQPGGSSSNSAQPGAIAPFFAVTEENFETDLVRRSTQVPVIALIGTARSPQSEQLKQDFAELAAQGGLSFVVGYVDADAHPQVAQVFGVQNLPTVVALAAGQPITSFEGGQPKEALEQWVAALVQQVGGKLEGLETGAGQPVEEEDALDPRVSEAEEALSKGDYDAAIAIYDGILAGDPAATEVKQARDTTRLLKRISGVTDPIAKAESDESVQAQLDAADAEVVAGAPEKAFTRLIEAMKLAVSEDKTLLRDRLLELFGLFDAADQRVLDARRALASALY